MLVIRGFLFKMSSSSSSSGSFPLSTFICGITLEVPSDAAETSCGHLFDFSSICRYVTMRYECPVCRTPISLADVNRSHFLNRVLKDYQPPVEPSSDSVQIVDVVDVIGPVDDVPELITAPSTPELDSHITHVADLPRFLFDDYDFSFAPRLPLLGQRRNRNFSRTVQLNSEFLFNGRSSNYSALSDHARSSNRNFIVRRSLHNANVDIFKYVYHHRGSLVSAIASAASHGYYIFDMFYVSPNRFALYSVSYRADFSDHHLDPFL